MSISDDDYFAQVWKPDLLGLAEHILNEVMLRGAWIDGAKDATAVYYPGELVAIFDDLNCDDIEKMLVRLHDAVSAKAVRAMVARADDLYNWAETHMDITRWGQGRPPSNAETIFHSQEWRDLRQAAEEVLRLIGDRAASCSTDGS